MGRYGAMRCDALRERDGENIARALLLFLLLFFDSKRDCEVLKKIRKRGVVR